MTNHYMQSWRWYLNRIQLRLLTALSCSLYDHWSVHSDRCKCSLSNSDFNNVFPVNFITLSQIIGNIFRKSLRLSGKSRINHSVGQITTMISTDATRLDRFSGFAHEYPWFCCAPWNSSDSSDQNLGLSYSGINQYSFLPLSQHFHLVGHWVWTSHQNRVYLSFLSNS